MSVIVYEMVVMGEGLCQVLAGQFVLFIVIIKDNDGWLVCIGSVELCVEIIGLDGMCFLVLVVDYKNGIYELVYIVCMEGELFFLVLFYGQLVCGSFFLCVCFVFGGFVIFFG